MRSLPTWKRSQIAFSVVTASSRRLACRGCGFQPQSILCVGCSQRRILAVDWLKRGGAKNAEFFQAILRDLRASAFY